MPALEPVADGAASEPDSLPELESVVSESEQPEAPHPAAGVGAAAALILRKSFANMLAATPAQGALLGVFSGILYTFALTS